MKKISLSLAILGFLISCVALYNVKSSSELVYVDVNKLIDGYKKKSIANLEFEKKTEGIKKELDTVLIKWQKELSLFDKERGSMSEATIKLKEAQLSNKEQQINNYQQEMQKKMQAENTRIMQSLVDDINEYVKEYGKEHGYKIIFGANGAGNIMFGDESADITDEVLSGLNKEYAKE